MFFGLNAGIALLLVIVVSSIIGAMTGGGFAVYNLVALNVQARRGPLFEHSPPKRGAPPTAFRPGTV